MQSDVCCPGLFPISIPRLINWEHIYRIYDNLKGPVTGEEGVPPVFPPREIHPYYHPREVKVLIQLNDIQTHLLNELRPFTFDLLSVRFDNS